MSPNEIYSTDMEKAAMLFAALGDPIRLAIITRLSDSGPLATVALRQNKRVSRQAITKHLQVLEQAGLVSSRRVGRDRQWRMEAERLAAAHGLLDQLSRQWDERIERLRAFVEAENP